MTTRDILVYLVPAAALSLAMGLLVASDSLLASYHPLWHLALDYKLAHNYLWTATTFVMLVAIAVGTKYWEWAFHHRYQIACILLIGTPALGGLQLGRLDPTDIAVLLVTPFWIVSVLAEDRPVPVPRVPIALLLCLAIFAVGSIIPGGPGVIRSMPSILSKLTVLFLVANLLTTPNDHHVAVRALIAIAVISACIAIVTEAAYLLTGFVFSLDDRVTERFKCLGWICLLRATGLSPAPQVLGHLLIIGVALALFLQVRTWFLLLIIIVLIVGGISTLSVGVLLSMGTVLVLFPILRWPWFYPYILISYLSIAWLTLVTGIGPWVYRFANDKLLASYGVDIRIWTYRRGAELIEQHPIFGIGVLKQIPGSMHFTTPHNAYLQIALQMGLPSAFFFITLMAYLFISSWRVATRVPDATSRHWMRALMLGLLGMMIHLVSEPLYTNNLPWAYMGLVMAGIIIYGRVIAAPRHAATASSSWPRLQRMSRTLLNAGYRS